MTVPIVVPYVMWIELESQGLNKRKHGAVKVYQSICLPIMYK